LWPRPARSHEVVTTTVLFDREIVRILTRRCVACHTEGNLAFPLLTYEQTRPWARAIEEEALRRHMPPWRAVRGYGEFANDNSLTSRELSFIVSWVEGHGPKSAGQTVITDIAATPATSVAGATAPDFARWQIGEPDVVIQLGTPAPAGSLSTPLVRAVVPVDVRPGRSIGAIEFKPGDRHTITAASFHVQETGQWLGTWTPWFAGAASPTGSAYVLPVRFHVVAEVHYRGAMPPSAPLGSLGLSYSREKRPARVTDLVLEAAGNVPARATTRKFRATTTLDADTYAVALWPRLRPGAQGMEVRARTPDGGTNVLLYLRDIVQEWPTPYVFKTPVFLPRGTEVVMAVTASNTAATPQPGGVTLTISRYRATSGGRARPRRSQ
jgi:hypothetical protein